MEEFDRGLATLLAALAAALASILTLVLRARSDRIAELRAANRDRLEPLLERLGNALYKIVACSVLAVRDSDTSNRAYYDEKKAEAQRELRALRGQVRYQLWGLDAGFKTLLQLPDWVNSKSIPDYDELLAAASDLRLRLDQSIQRCYRDGRPPSFLDRYRVLASVRRIEKEWSSLTDTVEFEKSLLLDARKRPSPRYEKTRATIVALEGDHFVARASDGETYRVRVDNRTGKGSRRHAVPGVEVHLYERPGEDFHRYRFVGNPAPISERGNVEDGAPRA